MHNPDSIIAFTICSNNYLAQAKSLGDSLLAYNPDYLFTIFLVDKLSDKIDYAFFKPYQIIPIDQIGIDGFDEMCVRYNITELNTSVKPFIFDYLFSNNKEVHAIIYLDPDILVYDQFSELENQLPGYNIILTPHFFTPIYDNYLISEPGILNAGLYNLGFIAVKRSDESDRFLRWWMIKLKDQCIIDFKNGFFVDQLWINFVPIYFESILILRHLGYNAAYWNFHERRFVCNNGKYTVNNQFALVFFHFSGYELNKPELISKYQTRYSFDQRQDIIPLYEDYRRKLKNNHFEEYALLPCYYVQLKEKLQTINQPITNIGNRGVVALCKHALKRFLFK